MKKKYVITGLTGLFLLITGICYSCAYNNKASAALLSGQNRQDISAEDVSSEGTISPAADNKSTENPTGTSLDSKAQTADQTKIFVHICGAVRQPGVYEADEGSRLIDIITLSGGLAKDAAGDYINQAEPVADGQRYYIPTVNDVADLSESEYIQGVQDNSKETGASFININTADTEQLMSLPGIGEAKASSIINYRNNNGKFKTIEDLMNIPGIKEGLFNQISSLIVVK